MNELHQPGVATEGLSLQQQVDQIASIGQAEQIADDRWCPDCGDPREACICKRPVKFYVAEPEPPAQKSRSEIVYAAERVIPSRFHLVGFVSTYTRKMHRPGEFVGATIRKALEYVACDGQEWKL